MDISKLQAAADKAVDASQKAVALIEALDSGSTDQAAVDAQADRIDAAAQALLDAVASHTHS